MSIMVIGARRLQMQQKGFIIRLASFAPHNRLSRIGRVRTRGSPVLLWLKSGEGECPQHASNDMTGRGLFVAPHDRKPRHFSAVASEMLLC